MDAHLTCRRIAAAVAAGGALAASTASAQLHEVRRDGFSLRANAVVSTVLSESSAAAHGIRRSPRTAILDVVVQRGNADTAPTVPAAVHASVEAPGAPARSISMRPVAANRRISYLGTFDLPDPGTRVAIRVRARPDGHDRDLELRFTDTVGAVP